VISMYNDIMLCTSGFVDDIPFPRNWVNGAEWKTTLFRRIRQVAAPGETSDAYDCFVKLITVYFYFVSFCAFQLCVLLYIFCICVCFLVVC